MKKTLKEFDIQVQEFVTTLASKRDKLRFNVDSSTEFILNNELDDSAFQSIINDQGIYLFELNLSSANLKGEKCTTKLSNFAKMWHTNPYNLVYSPNVINKRQNMYEKDFTSDWLPLYIGKCKKVKNRILNHINLPKDSKTYALKLKARKNLYGCVFRVSYIQLNVMNYNFIAPSIEQALRDSYNPIIGRQ